jgi:hypothetical protein
MKIGAGNGEILLWKRMMTIKTGRVIMMKMMTGREMIATDRFLQHPLHLPVFFPPEGAGKLFESKIALPDEYTPC